MEEIGTIKNIYDHLQDGLSRTLFADRLLYTLTGDEGYIKRMIGALPQKADLDKAVTACREHMDKLVLYGAGNDLSLLSGLYPDLKIRSICDRDKKKQQEGWNKILVMSPEELIARREGTFVGIVTSGSYGEIRSFLLENGFTKEQIINLSMVTDVERQYFDKEILSPVPDEVFIDGGCFNCDTDKRFIKWCSGEYKRIYAFEPDKRNHEKCLEICRREEIKNIRLYHKGLWDCETDLFFEETGGQGSRIGEGAGAEGAVHIATAAIDAVVGEDKVTFIKLDVEGAELKALQGAEQTIRRHRPRLAVSIYHKPEDVLLIPRYLLSLQEDLRLYIRHYQMSGCETILYAL